MSDLNDWVIVIELESGFKTKDYNVTIHHETTRTQAIKNATDYLYKRDAIKKLRAMKVTDIPIVTGDFNV